MINNKEIKASVEKVDKENPANETKYNLDEITKSSLHKQEVKSTNSLNERKEGKDIIEHNMEKDKVESGLVNEEKVKQLQKMQEQTVKLGHKEQTEQKKHRFAFTGIIKQKGDKIEKKLEEQKQHFQEILAKSEISLILDTYDDIFSDFDPRPYSQRALSDDFLREARKAFVEAKPGVLELRLLIPETERKLEAENIIKKRLKDYFRRQHAELEAEERELKDKGILLASLGFFLVFVAATFADLEKQNLFYRLIFVILEPSGWFCLWFGFDHIFSFARKKSADLEFYSKMKKADIVFVPYKGFSLKEIKV